VETTTMIIIKQQHNHQYIPTQEYQFSPVIINPRTLICT